MRRSLAVLALLVGFAAPVLADWKIDGAHSSVNFKVKHLGVSNFYGRFDKIDGTIVWDDKDLSKSKIDAVVDADSVNSGNADRDKHLKSGDFFNTKQFEKITFKSTKIEKGASDKHFTVTGDLTLHGVTKSVTAKLEITGQGKGMKGEERIGAEVTLTVKRSEFGVKYGLPDAVGDDVELTIAVEAIKG